MKLEAEVIRIDPRALELMDVWADDDPLRRARVSFPLTTADGAASSSLVYFEIEPGNHLGMHTDSAEELLLVVAGRGEATVGDERAPLAAGQLALVPALAPHDVHNTGEATLKVLGYFSSSAIVSVFETPWSPLGARIVSTRVPDDIAVA